jgi:hypothetical protein
MNTAALTLPVNPCYFARERDTGDRTRAAVRRSISVGALVKNNENTSAATGPRSPLPFPTYGLDGVIAIDASHNRSISSRPNKPQPNAPSGRSARHC